MPLHPFPTLSTSSFFSLQAALAPSQSSRPSSNMLESLQSLGNAKGKWSKFFSLHSFLYVSKRGRKNAVLHSHFQSLLSTFRTNVVHFLCFNVNYMWNHCSYSHICLIPSILEHPQLQSMGRYNHTHQHYSNVAIFSTDFKKYVYDYTCWVIQLCLCFHYKIFKQ